jgi:acyl-coenzyme A thioesterase PaaI-like protein
MNGTPIQDYLHGNLCFGCGIANPNGLQIKSYWDGQEAVCHFTPQPHHSAGPPHILNGGIIATIIDCHGICTALAEAYDREGRPIGSDPKLWYVTGRFDLSYLKPTLIAGPVELRAKVVEAKERKSVVEVSASCNGVETAKASVIAVRVPTTEFLEG